MAREDASSTSMHSTFTAGLLGTPRRRKFFGGGAFGTKDSLLPLLLLALGVPLLVESPLSVCEDASLDAVEELPEVSEAVGSGRRIICIHNNALVQLVSTHWLGPLVWPSPTEDQYQTIRPSPRHCLSPPSPSSPVRGLYYAYLPLPYLLPVPWPIVSAVFWLDKGSHWHS